MKKKLLYIFVITYILISLCSCKNDNGTNIKETDSTKDTTQEKEQETMVNTSEETEIRKETPTIQETEELTTVQETEEAALSPSDLEAILLQQPCYIESTKYIIQHEQFKALYPDMLSVILKNNSGTDIKSAVIAFAAWDKNNLPVKIIGDLDFSGGSYIRSCNYEDINLINGETFGENKGMAIDENTAEIGTFKAIVVSYSDFDGKTWENPYYQNWLDIYENQKLPQ